MIFVSSFYCREKKISNLVREMALNGFKNIDHAGSNTGYKKSDYLAKVRFNTPRSFSMPAALEVKYSVTDELSNETYLGLSRSDFLANPLRRYAASGIAENDVGALTAVERGGSTLANMGRWLRQNL